MNDAAQNYYGKVTANAQGMGTLIHRALLEGAEAIAQATEAAACLDAGDVEGAKRHLSLYLGGVRSGSDGSAYDDPAVVLAEGMPQPPSDTSGY